MSLEPTPGSFPFGLLTLGFKDHALNAPSNSPQVSHPGPFGLIVSKPNAACFVHAVIQPIWSPQSPFLRTDKATAREP